MVALFVMTFVFSGACSSTVDVETSSSSGGCAGNGPFCAQGCGSDAFEQAICKKGAWVCPPGSVDADTCPAGTCWGPPLPCEECNGGWTCVANKECAGSCGGIVCATCEGAPAGTTVIGACACSCNGSSYSCAPLLGCCNQDFDCGDETLTPCVNNVCKTPVMGGCWSDVECGGMKCQGAIVCPCGSDCKVPDSPGMCVPI